MKIMTSFFLVLLIMVVGCEVPETRTAKPVTVKAELTRAASISLGYKSPAKTKKPNMWKIQNYVDDFGDPTTNRYLTNKTRIRGTFSNTATQDSRLDAYFLINDGTDISLKLYEYSGNNPVKAYSATKYTVIVKKDDESRLILTAINYSDRLRFYDDSRILHNALLKNKALKFLIIETETPTTKYSFTVDATGYTATYKELMIIQNVKN